MLQHQAARMTLAELDLRPDQVRSLYLIHLQQMYSAAEQLLYGIPTIAIAVAEPDMKQLLLEEATITPDHLELLQRTFAELGEVPLGPVCMPVKALIDLSSDLILQHPFGPGRDLLLMAAAVEMKHLNVAKFMMAATFARSLGFTAQNRDFSRNIRKESMIERKINFFLQNFEIDVGRRDKGTAVTDDTAVLTSPPVMP